MVELGSKKWITHYCHSVCKINLFEIFFFFFVIVPVIFTWSFFGHHNGIYELNTRNIVVDAGQDTQFFGTDVGYTSFNQYAASTYLDNTNASKTFYFRNNT